MPASSGLEARAPADARSSELERLRGEIDSVYFLVSGGWQTELESNRWHYARRWARHLPVTLVQPRQRLPLPTDATPVAAIANCDVLTVLQPGGAAASPLRGLLQAAQLMEHMARRGHGRPLLWSYNPSLAGLYAAVPAVARVYHATENYFDFDGLPPFFHLEFEASLRISDLVIAVSSGVADTICSRVPEARLEVVTNGCDVGHYRPAGATSATIAARRREFERVAVFAGNINSRVDFELVQQAAESNRSTLLVFAGPASSLDRDDAKRWRSVLGLKNVQHLGQMPPEELAALYRSCDLGFIPYRPEKRIVRNGFPLKTLEMGATGLPVVATHMKPILGLASAIVVAEDDEKFLDSFASLSRSSLANEERLELLRVAAANDYDGKFEQVARYVADSIPEGRATHTRLDDLLAALGDEAWQASCARLFDLAKPSLLRRGGARLAYDGLTNLVPTDTRNRLIPSGLRRWARSRVE